MSESLRSVFAGMLVEIATAISTGDFDNPRLERAHEGLRGNPTTLASGESGQIKCRILQVHDIAVAADGTIAVSARGADGHGRVEILDRSAPYGDWSKNAPSDRGHFNVSHLQWERGEISFSYRDDRGLYHLVWGDWSVELAPEYLVTHRQGYNKGEEALFNRKFLPWLWEDSEGARHMAVQISQDRVCRVLHLWRAKGSDKTHRELCSAEGAYVLGAMGAFPVIGIRRLNSVIWGGMRQSGNGGQALFGTLREVEGNRQWLETFPARGGGSIVFLMTIDGTIGQITIDGKVDIRAGRQCRGGDRVFFVVSEGAESRERIVEFRFQGGMKSFLLPQGYTFRQIEVLNDRTLAALITFEKTDRLVFIDSASGELIDGLDEIVLRTRGSSMRRVGDRLILYWQDDREVREDSGRAIPVFSVLTRSTSIDSVWDGLIRTRVRAGNTTVKDLVSVGNGVCTVRHVGDGTISFRKIC